MNVLVVMGPVASGKTDLLTNTLKAIVERNMYPKDKLRYIVNDTIVEGAGTMGVDAGIASKYARVHTMTNGCFTCESPQELRDMLAKSKDEGVELVFVEGFGLTSGVETLEFFETAGYPYQVFGLYDFANHTTNIIDYGAVYPSFARAPSGIFLTKVGEPEGPEVDSFFDFVSIHKTNHTTPIVPLPHGGHIPLHRLEESHFWITSKTVHHGNLQIQILPFGHIPHKQHHHDHIHDIPVEGYSIWGDVAPETVREAINKLGKGVRRAKFATQGRVYHLEPSGAWREGELHDGSFLTVYFRGGKQDLEKNPFFRDIVIPKSTLGIDARPTYTKLRDETGIPTEETIHRIKELLSIMPQAPLVTKNSKGQFQILTHPEYPLQLVKEICRRPSVKSEWHHVVIERCIHYWIQCGTWLLHHEDEVNPEQIAKNKRELAVSLAWWTLEFGNRYAEDTVSQVTQFPLVLWLAEGLFEFKALHADPVLAPWECLEFCRVFTFGKDYSFPEECDMAFMQLRRLHKLAKAYPHQIEFEGMKELKDVYAQEIHKLEVP